MTCFNARSHGTCGNLRSIKRQEVEVRVLRAMRERLFDPGVFDQFCTGFTEEVNRLRREHRMQIAAIPREIAGIDRRSKEILELLLQRFRDESWKEELRKLDERRTELRAILTTAEIHPPKPAPHPHMAEVFRQKATFLAGALEHDERRDTARQALRGFVEKIVIPPGDGLLRLVGNFEEMLTAASGRNGSDLAASVMVVAGACNQRYLQLWSGAA